MKKKELPMLQIEAVQELNTKQMKDIKGGFLSIGWNCSERNKCPRHHTKTWSINPPPIGSRKPDCYYNPLPLG